MIIILASYYSSKTIALEVAKKSSDLYSLLLSSSKTKAKHSTGEIGLFLEGMDSKPAPKKTAANISSLQNFLSEQSDPLYQSAMKILQNKQLQNSYRQALFSIKLFFSRYIEKHLQHFYVHSSIAQTLTESYKELSPLGVLVPLSHPVGLEGLLLSVPHKTQSAL